MSGARRFTTERALLEEAFRLFLDERDRQSPRPGYPISYDFSKEVHAKWPALMNLQVSSDLQESINLQNAWCSRLMEWQAWLPVLEHFDDDDAWSIRNFLVEPIAFWCMSQPSAARDRFCAIATFSAHQANLMTDRGYKDRLDQDDHPRRFLSRAKSEAQLRRIAGRWATYGAMNDALAKMNGEAYRGLTRNFRNLASHGIAPRFEFGEIGFVTRSIGPSTDLVAQEGGTFKEIERPSKRAVSYAFGGLPALSLRDMRDANEKEYALATATLDSYQALLREFLIAFDAKQ